MAIKRAAAGLLIAVLGFGTPLGAQAPRTAVPAADTYTHLIAKGDTLIALARLLLVEWRDWRQVARLNRVRNPRRLLPGRTLVFPIALMRSLPGDARILWVRGQPRIDHGGGTAIVALLGATVPAGATIITAVGDALRLRLSTGSDVTIGERARLTLVELRSLAGGTVTRTLLDAGQGRIETTVPPSTHPAQRHQIRTPVVTATVRGTAFRVAVNDASVATEVTEGVVQVGRQADVLAVDAGFGVRARPGEALPAPTRLLPPPRLADLVVAGARLPVRVTWPAVAGAIGYRVRVVADADAAPVLEERLAGPAASWSDLPDGAYQLEVRGVDADDLEGVEARAAFTVDARPVPPLVQAAADGRPVYGDGLDLQWTRPADVESFDLQVTRDGDASQPVAERTGLTDVRVSLPLPPGRYTWRVASRIGDERGPWGDPVGIELRARPAAGPPPEAQVLRRELTLRWSAGLPGERYAVQVSSDPAFGTTLVDTVVSEPSLTMPRPPRGRYHVRLRLLNAEGVEGPYGPTQSLDVPRPPRSKWWWLLLPAAAAGIVVAGR